MSWATVPPPPTAQPFRGTGRGTFSESGAITDSGTVEIAAQDVALPSPIVGIVEAHFTLISDARTLSLRCKQSSTDFNDLAAVRGTGTCAVVGGTGLYANVHGQGGSAASPRASADRHQHD